MFTSELISDFINSINYLSINAIVSKISHQMAVKIIIKSKLVN